jgi:hypothetical protein
VQAEPAVGGGEEIDAETASAAAEATRGEPIIYTEAGLPWRKRQASLAAQLRDQPAESTAPADPAPARHPEEIRRLMSSYQTGTRRGRSDADQAASWSTAPAPPAQSTAPRAPTSPAPVEVPAPRPPECSAGVAQLAADPAPSTQHIPRAEPADGQQS